MNLVIDIGNTLVKAGLFIDKNLVSHHTDIRFEISFLENFFLKYPAINRGIISVVGKADQEVIQFLTDKAGLMFFSPETPVPVINRYHSPATLGSDRLAAVVGAYSLFPGETILVIDAGTCITYDLLTQEKEYLGGGISPGIRLRFNSLHDYTSKLPRLEPEMIRYLAGKSTYESIMSGVMNGTLCEIKGLIDWYSRQYDVHKVVMTGGDLLYFEKPLKSIIFAVPNLVLHGLNEILEYNCCQ